MWSQQMLLLIQKRKITTRRLEEEFDTLGRAWMWIPLPTSNHIFKSILLWSFFLNYWMQWRFRWNSHTHTLSTKQTQEPILFSLQKLFFDSILIFLFFRFTTHLPYFVNSKELSMELMDIVLIPTMVWILVFCLQNSSSPRLFLLLLYLLFLNSRH